MNLKAAAQALVYGTFAVWIGFDVYLAKHGGPTESMIVRDAGRSSTFFAHLMGFLMGHWFFPRQHQFVYGWMWGILIWVLLIGWDVAWAIWGKSTPWYRFEGIWVLVGILSGTLLWCQADGGSPLP